MRHRASRNALRLRLAVDDRQGSGVVIMHFADHARDTSHLRVAHVSAVARFFVGSCQRSTGRQQQSEGQTGAWYYASRRIDATCGFNTTCRTQIDRVSASRQVFLHSFRSPPETIAGCFANKYQEPYPDGCFE